MPIPDFTADGVLPPGRYGCTQAEFYQRFVAAFPGSKTREPLYRGWEAHWKTVSAVVPILSEWIDGSFVEEKTDPNDIDLCVILDGPVVDGLPLAARQALFRLVTPVGKPLFNCHCFPILVYPDGHPYRNYYFRNRGQWDSWWGETRSNSPKGYVEVR